MAQWRVRSPGSFPIAFHQAMALGIGVDKVAGRYRTKQAAKGAQVDWRIFRYSLRAHPSHPLFEFEHGFVHVTRVRWAPDSGMWELVLTTRATVLQDMRILPASTPQTR